MKIAIVTNILTPYRIFFFDKLNETLAKNGDVLKVYSMCKEKGDRTWKYDDLKRDYTDLLPGFKFCIKGLYVFFNNPYSALKSFRPDVVICAGSYWLPTTLAVEAIKKHLKYRTFMWSESHVKEKKDNGRFIVSIREIIRKKIFGSFDGFLIASKLARKLVEPYAKKNAVYIPLPNTVNQEFFHKAFTDASELRGEYRKRFSLSEDVFVFLIAARLNKEKGIVEFLKLYKNVETKNKACILIAGDGPLRSEIEEYANSHNIRIKLLGNKTQDEMVGLLACADCFLLPSLSDPNPLSVIEALWAGKPLFISDGVGNQNEAVIEKQNGFIFSYDDTENAIRNLDSIISKSAEWRREASEISISLAERHFDITKVINNLTEMIK